MPYRAGSPPRIIGSVLLVFSLAACASKPINHVLADPGQYRDRTVRVAGNVTESLGLAGYGFFKVEDETGGLWVFSRRGLPRQGAKVAVTGEVKDIAALDSLARTADGRNRVPEGLARALRNGVVLVEDGRKAQ